MLLVLHWKYYIYNIKTWLQIQVCLVCFDSGFLSEPYLSHALVTVVNKLSESQLWCRNLALLCVSYVTTQVIMLHQAEGKKSRTERQRKASSDVWFPSYTLSGSSFTPFLTQSSDTSFFGPPLFVYSSGASYAWMVLMKHERERKIEDWEDRWKRGRVEGHREREKEDERKGLVGNRERIFTS